jgi:hypothetical protein
MVVSSRLRRSCLVTVECRDVEADIPR